MCGQGRGAGRDMGQLGSPGERPIPAGRQRGEAWPLGDKAQEGYLRKELESQPPSDCCPGQRLERFATFPEAQASNLQPLSAAEGKPGTARVNLLQSAALPPLPGTGDHSMRKTGAWRLRLESGRVPFLARGPQGLLSRSVSISPLSTLA